MFKGLHGLYIFIVTFSILLCCNLDRGSVVLDITDRIYRISTEATTDDFMGTRCTDLCPILNAPGVDAIKAAWYPDNSSYVVVNKNATDDFYEGTESLRIDLTSDGTYDAIGMLYVNDDDSSLNWLRYADFGVLKFMIKRTAYTGDHRGYIVMKSSSDIVYPIKESWVSGNWEEAEIRLADFAGVEFNMVKMLFGIKLIEGNSATYYVDHIRIECE